MAFYDQDSGALTPVRAPVPLAPSSITDLNNLYTGFLRPGDAAAAGDRASFPTFNASGPPDSGPGSTSRGAAPYPTQPTQPNQTNQTTPANASTDPFLSDPGYASASAAEQLGVGSLNQQLNNQIAQRIIAFGDPGLASMAGFGLDPQSAAFARQNYLSGNAELARIDQAHKLARQAIINRLASHGLLTSGDTGYQEGLENQNYGNNVYDAQQKVLSDILGYRQGSLDRQNVLHNATVAALEHAFDNYASNPALYGLGNTASAPPPPTTNPVPHVAAAHVPSTRQAILNSYTTGRKARG